MGCQIWSDDQFTGKQDTLILYNIKRSQSTVSNQQIQWQTGDDCKLPTYQMIIQADSAMYKIKKGNKNGIGFYIKD